MITIGFPRNLYILQGFPTTYTIFPFEEYIQGFSVILTALFPQILQEKTYRHPINHCKHLQCTEVALKTKSSLIASSNLISSTCFNPFIYGRYNEAFQKEFINLIPSLTYICGPPLGGETQTQQNHVTVRHFCKN